MGNDAQLSFLEADYYSRLHYRRPRDQYVPGTAGYHAVPGGRRQERCHQ